jgi:hypothetical protein
MRLRQEACYAGVNVLPAVNYSYAPVLATFKPRGSVVPGSSGSSSGPELERSLEYEEQRHFWAPARLRNGRSRPWSAIRHARSHSR